MYDFILQIIIMVSLGAVIYLMARAIPRVSEMPVVSERRDYVKEIIQKIPLEKIDYFLNSLASKFLRKAKVFTLKIDNLISDTLNKVKSGNGKENPKPFENSSEDSKVK